MYTFVTEDHYCKSKKAKSINKKVTDDELKYVNYKSVLFTKSHTRHEMNRIQIEDYSIGLHRTNTTSLSS